MLPTRPAAIADRATSKGLKAFHAVGHPTAGPITLKIQMSFSQHCLGRMFLHLGCIIRGGNIKWHLVGIRRELSHRFSTNPRRRVRGV